MIACFENLIGIKTECGTYPASGSGFYLQDLPMINLKLATSVNDGEESGYDWLKSKLDFATETLASDVRTRMAPYFLQNSVLENMQAGFYRDNQQLNAGQSGMYKGIQIRVSEYPYLNVYLSSLSMYCDFTGEVPIKVIDLVQAKIIDTITIDAVAGEIVTIPIHKEYQNNGQYLNLFIGYDSSSIDSYTSSIYSMPGRYIGGCLDCRPGFSFRNKWVAVYSRSLSTDGPFLMNNLSGINECGGLSLTISLSCSLNKWLCQMRNTLALSLLYKAGIEILKEAQVTPRFNSLIALSKDKFESLMLDYETNYATAMDNVFKNLRLPDDVCFKCNAKVKTGFVSL